MIPSSALDLIERLPVLKTEDNVIESLIDAAKCMGFITSRYWDVLYCSLDRRHFYTLRAAEDRSALGLVLERIPLSEADVAAGNPIWFSSRDKKVTADPYVAEWIDQLCLSGRGWFDVPITAAGTPVGLWSLIYPGSRRPRRGIEQALRTIAMVAGLKIHELRQSVVASSTGDIFTDVDYGNPVDYCLRTICRTLRASVAAYYKVDQIRNVVHKESEIWFDGAEFRTLEGSRSDGEYPRGMHLTGAAVDDSSYHNIPFIPRLVERRPGLIDPVSQRFHEERIGAPVRSILFRRVDIPGAMTGIIRVMNRADHAHLSFTGLHEAIIDRLVVACAHIMAVKSAADHLRCIQETATIVMTQVQANELDFRPIAARLAHQGFPYLAVTIWDDHDVLRDCWTNSFSLTASLRAKALNKVGPGLQEHASPWLCQTNELPTSLRDALADAGFSLTYCVPTEESFSDRYELEKVICIVPLGNSVQTPATRRLNMAFWKARPNMLTFISVVGQLIGAGRVLARNQDLLYLAEQAVGTIGHEMRSPAAKLQSLSQAIALHARSALAQVAAGEQIQQIVDEISPEGESIAQTAMGPEALRTWIETQNASIVTYSHYLDRVVSDSLRWARMSGNVIEANFQRVDLYSVLVECVSVLHREIRERAPIRVEIRENIKSIPAIVADEFYLHILFTNLLDNAIKYSHNPGPKHEFVVRVLAIPQPQLIDVQFVNWGIGIAEADYKNVFSSFYRSPKRDERHGVRGVGLGLPTCRKVARIHNGDISVVSRPTLSDARRRQKMEGFETTFTVRLPRTLQPGRVDIDAGSLTK